MPPLSESRFLDLHHGIRIHYRTAGHGPTAMVFLHGFAAALTTWEELVPRLPAEEFTLYLLDLKGFGFSSKPYRGSYAVEEQAAVVTAFIAALGLQRVVLVGHSLGGGIALLVAIDAVARGARERLAALVLIDSAAYPQPLPRMMRWLQLPLLSRLALAVIPVRRLVVMTLAKVYYSATAITPERIARYENCFGGRGMARVLIRTARAIEPARYGQMAMHYRKLGLPALIIWGANDRIVRCEAGRRLAGDIPGARLTVFEQCGHNPHEERPAETAAAIIDFLKGINGRPAREAGGEQSDPER
ncbi:alpha/beta hydrolase [Geotalea uraniireducens]|uniref:Alpha/beta hydrolase n=1 Tax=Geotalea uraniireducens TaxID=351604 RepID=A0ABN6VUD4_9BACT|nr:alpha/beta hydrolase [Geotalea uraniireducens]BDV43921.1 alpha/beta hydrolase [Geotalea uraniireducens]